MTKLFVVSSLVLLSASTCMANWSCVAACAGESWDFTYVSGEGTTAVEAFKAMQKACASPDGSNKLVSSAVALRLGSESAGWTLAPGWSPVTLSSACAKD